MATTSTTTLAPLVQPVYGEKKRKRPAKKGPPPPKPPARKGTKRG